jgi:hypothetical protein
MPVRILERISATIVLGLLVLVAAPARAQQTPGTPEAAAQQYVDALRAGDYGRVAGLTHPDAMRQFKAAMSAMVAMDSSGEALSALFSVRTRAEFDALPPQEVFARMMKQVVETRPGFGALMSSMTADILGHVTENSDTAHVVYRMHMSSGGVSVAKMDVISMQRSGGQWLALLSGDLQAIVDQAKRRSGSK